MMTSTTILARLRASGLLLEQDRRLPSVVGYLAGEPIRGSWWRHPQSHQIYSRLGVVHSNPDVLTTRLVAGKITLVHRRLWPAILAIGLSRSRWQREGLSPAAQALLKRVRQVGQLRSSGPAAHELSRRLLVHDRQVHTEAGHHALLLETWPRWASRVGCRTDLSPAQARVILEQALQRIGGSPNLLPWCKRKP